MAKYILKTTTKWVNTDQETELDYFTDEDFERYKKGEMTKEENQDYHYQAVEDQGLEWWIEKVEEK